MERLQTRYKFAEERIRHVNFVLHAIQKVNQIIIREKDHDSLPKKVCDALIETRGYYNAWIVLLDESGSLVRAAEAGLGKDFSPMIEKIKRGHLTDCGRRALLQSEVVLTEDPISTCMDCPLSTMYRDRGAITVRLEYGRKLYGLLCVSTNRNFLPDEEERALFKEVANDIALALHSSETEEKRKPVEEALTESEERYRNLFEQSKDAIYITSWKGRLSYINQSFLDLFGYTREEIRDLEAQEMYVNPDDRYKFQEEIEKKESVRDFEVKLKKKDGAEMDCLITATVRRVGDRSILGYQGIIRDITEQKRAQIALQDSEERYKALVDRTLYCVYIHDFKGQFLDLNNFFLNLLGYTKKEIPSLNFSTILPEEEVPIAFKYLKETIRNGFKKTPSKYRVRKKNGSYALIETESAVIFRQGRPYAIQGIARDITDQTRAEEALKEQKNELELKTRDLEELNVVLRVLVKKIEEDKIELEEKILSNIKELILPYLERLENTQLNERQKTYISILEANLDDIISPFIRRLSTDYLKFTPMEIQVANLVKYGRNTKEIAEFLNLSKETIDSHRKSIRKKIGIRNKKANLRTYLLSIK